MPPVVCVPEGLPVWAELSLRGPGCRWFSSGFTAISFVVSGGLVCGLLCSFHGLGWFMPWSMVVKSVVCGV